MDGAARIFRFGPFEFDAGRFELRRDGNVVPAEPQTLRVLAYFLANAGQLVGRGALVAEIWDGRIVSDWAISAAIRAVRVALDDTGTEKTWLKTVHGQGFRFSDQVRASDGADQPLLAVLPFAPDPGEDGSGYFADGVTEDLIASLAALPGLRVVSRISTFSARATGVAPDAFAARLGVTHLISGAIRQQDGRQRIHVELADTAAGTTLWAERFEGPQADIFALQDRISARVAGSLALILPPGKARRPDPVAHDHLLRGRAEYFRYRPDAMMRAAGHFQAAIDADPDYAEGYAYLSYCRTATHVFALPGADPTLDGAEALARKAVALDAASGVAHARLGWVLGYLGQPDATIDAFRTATALDPRNAEIWHNFGETLNRLARPDQALPHLERAFSLDSYVPPSWDFARGHARLLLGEQDEAIRRFRGVLDIVPGFVPARVQLVRALIETGRTDDASAEVAAIAAKAPRFSRSTAARMFPYPDPVEYSRLQQALEAAGMQAVA